VRELLQRMTAIAALLTGVCVAWINYMTETPWPLTLARAAAALGIVIAAGFIIGSILMRTAVRRHYEAWLSQSRRRRAGAER
jgi:uncharacterized membrane protein YraQ (UPF0718 family)